MADLDAYVLVPTMLSKRFLALASVRGPRGPAGLTAQGLKTKDARRCQGANIAQNGRLFVRGDQFRAPGSWNLESKAVSWGIWCGFHE